MKELSFSLSLSLCYSIRSLLLPYFIVLLCCLTFFRQTLSPFVLWGTLVRDFSILLYHAVLCMEAGEA